MASHPDTKEVLNWLPDLTLGALIVAVPYKTLANYLKIDNSMKKSVEHKQLTLGRKPSRILQSDCT